jgi:hypothetical protein
MEAAKGQNWAVEPQEKKDLTDLTMLWVIKNRVVFYLIGIIGRMLTASECQVSYDVICFTHLTLPLGHLH